jgi:hypothetical protein
MLLSQVSQGTSEETFRFPSTATVRDYNLKERVCCRFAADLLQIQQTLIIDTTACSAALSSGLVLERVVTISLFAIPILRL